MKVLKWIASAIGTVLLIFSIIYIAKNFEAIASVIPFESIKNFFVAAWEWFQSFWDKILGAFK